MRRRKSFLALVRSPQRAQPLPIALRATPDEGVLGYMARDAYCGLGELLWVELGAGVEDVGALCEVGGSDDARGASGPVVMALSGFSR